jgi:outer membrane receptor protein involved in Fe transport
LELEAAALLGAGWRVTGSAAYTEAKFSEDAPEANLTKGVRLPFVPRVTAAFSADWRGAPLWGAWRPSARVDHRYVSQRLDPNNGPAALGERGVDLPAYQLTNLRLGLAGGRWNLSLFVNNLLDKDVVLERVAVFVPSGFVAAQADRLREEYVERPRTIGLTLETRF